MPELSIKQNSMLVHLLQVGPKFGREYTHAHVTETQLHVGLTWNKAYSVANQWVDTINYKLIYWRNIPENSWKFSWVTVSAWFPNSPCFRINLMVESTPGLVVGSQYLCTHIYPFWWPCHAVMSRSPWNLFPRVSKGLSISTENGPQIC